jgi:ribulose-5-phosphate 4-epimerase/fuculose-1-phosphate aldolase
MSQADEVRRNVAISCRILGMFGMVRGNTGHVSARVPGSDSEMWVRCRGGRELGLTFTGVHNIRRVDFTGQGPGMDEAHARPYETPIHGETLRNRPEVGAVIHAHPPYALLSGVTNLQFKPIWGAYDPGALDMIVRGIPVFPRSVLINTPELGQQMAAAMGDRDVLFLKGHGVTVVGSSVEAATIQAVRLNHTCELMWELARTGLKADEISAEDLATFDRRGRAPAERTGWGALPGVDTWDWDHYVKMLEVSGIGLPDDDG